MKFEFNLGADDYVAMNMSSYSSRQVLRAYVPLVLCEALIAWILLHHLFGASLFMATVVAALAFLAGLAYHTFNWRQNYINRITAHYNAEAHRGILGPHTLELTDAGLVSAGPLHQSLRRWPSVTHVVLTPGHALFHTAFAVVYVLPLRAVPDQDTLLRQLSEVYGIKVQKA